MLISTCRNCNQDFTYDPHDGKRGIYCSQKCYYAFREPKLIECAYCKIAFKPRRKHTRFCSISCQSKNRSVISPRYSDGICECCGKAFKYERYNRAGRFCSRSCAVIATRGEKHPTWKGGMRSKPCLNCGKVFRYIACREQIARFCSSRCNATWHYHSLPDDAKEVRKAGIRKAGQARWDRLTKEERRKALAGANNPRWLGGTDEYRGKDWEKARLETLERDDHACQRCKRTDRLIVHHKIPWRISHNSSLSNLITLCIYCHHTVEREYWRKHKTPQIAMLLE